MGRIIIFTGKGGVGKSSIAAAHGVKAAKEGKKTIIISTDMAHNLGDIFNVNVGSEPVQVLENLSIVEVDPNYELENNYNNISKIIGSMVSGVENSDIVKDISIMPGSEELLSLIKIKEYYDEDKYDLIIVDCAPTGETLALLKFPELLSWYMEKLFPIGRVAMKVLRPISKAAFKVELPDTAAMNDIERLYMDLSKLQDLLKNRDVCSVRLVTIPEKMVVEETKRSYMYLNLYNFNVDGLYINRILPKTVENEFFNQWKLIQGNYLEEINNIFMDIKTYKVKWYESDLNGIEYLERLCNDSLDDNEIFKVLKRKENEIFEKIDNGYSLKVFIPFANKEDFDIYQSDRELIIKIGNFKRNISLPNVVREYSVSKAKLEDGLLKIIFN